MKKNEQFQNQLSSHLSLFEKATEWADLAVYIQKFLKLIGDEYGFDDIKNISISVKLWKVIWLCLDISLPSGIHIKILKLCNQLFENSTRKYVISNMVHMLSAIESLYGYGNTVVKKAILEIYESYVLPNIPNFKNISINVILPIIIVSENSQSYDYQRLQIVFDMCYKSWGYETYVNTLLKASQSNINLLVCCLQEVDRVLKLLHEDVIKQILQANIAELLKSMWPKMELFKYESNKINYYRAFKYFLDILFLMDSHDLIELFVDESDSEIVYIKYFFVLAIILLLNVNDSSLNSRLQKFLSILPGIYIHTALNYICKLDKVQDTFNIVTKVNKDNKKNMLKYTLQKSFDQSHNNLDSDKYIENLIDNVSSVAANEPLQNSFEPIDVEDDNIGTAIVGKNEHELSNKNTTSYQIAEIEDADLSNSEEKPKYKFNLIVRLALLRDKKILEFISSFAFIIGEYNISNCIYQGYLQLFKKLPALSIRFLPKEHILFILYKAICLEKSTSEVDIEFFKYSYSKLLSNSINIVEELLETELEVCSLIIYNTVIVQSIHDLISLETIFIYLFNKLTDDLWMSIFDFVVMNMWDNIVIEKLLEKNVISCNSIELKQSNVNNLKLIINHLDKNLTTKYVFGSNKWILCFDIPNFFEQVLNKLILAWSSNDEEVLSKFNLVRMSYFPYIDSIIIYLDKEIDTFNCDFASNFIEFILKYYNSLKSNSNNYLYVSKYKNMLGVIENTYEIFLPSFVSSKLLNIFHKITMQNNLNRLNADYLTFIILIILGCNRFPIKKLYDILSHIDRNNIKFIWTLYCKKPNGNKINISSIVIDFLDHIVKKYLTVGNQIVAQYIESSDSTLCNNQLLVMKIINIFTLDEYRLVIIDRYIKYLCVFHPSYYFVEKQLIILKNVLINFSNIDENMLSIQKKLQEFHQFTILNKCIEYKGMIIIKYYNKLLANFFEAIGNLNFDNSVTNLLCYFFGWTNAEVIAITELHMQILIELSKESLTIMVSTLKLLMNYFKSQFILIKDKKEFYDSIQTTDEDAELPTVKLFHSSNIPKNELDEIFVRLYGNTIIRLLAHSCIKQKDDELVKLLTDENEGIDERKSKLFAYLSQIDNYERSNDQNVAEARKSNMVELLLRSFDLILAPQQKLCNNPNDFHTHDQNKLENSLTKAVTMLLHPVFYQNLKSYSVYSNVLHKLFFINPRIMCTELIRQYNLTHDTIHIELAHILFHYNINNYSYSYQTFINSDETFLYSSLILDYVKFNNKNRPYTQSSTKILDESIATPLVFLSNYFKSKVVTIDPNTEDAQNENDYIDKLEIDFINILLFFVKTLEGQQVTYGIIFFNKYINMYLNTINVKSFNNLLRNYEDICKISYAIDHHVILEFFINILAIYDLLNLKTKYDITKDFTQKTIDRTLECINNINIYLYLNNYSTNEAINNSSYEMLIEKFINLVIKYKLYKLITELMKNDKYINSLLKYNKLTTFGYLLEFLINHTITSPKYLKTFKIQFNMTIDESIRRFIEENNNNTKSLKLYAKYCESYYYDLLLLKIYGSLKHSLSIDTNTYKGNNLDDLIYNALIDLFHFEPTNLKIWPLNYSTITSKFKFYCEKTKTIATYIFGMNQKIIQSIFDPLKNYLKRLREMLIIPYSGKYYDNSHYIKLVSITYLCYIIILNKLEIIHDDEMKVDIKLMLTFCCACINIRRNKIIVLLNTFIFDMLSLQNKHPTIAAYKSLMMPNSLQTVKAQPITEDYVENEHNNNISISGINNFNVIHEQTNVDTEIITNVNENLNTSNAELYSVSTANNIEKNLDTEDYKEINNKIDNEQSIESQYNVSNISKKNVEQSNVEKVIKTGDFDQNTEKLEVVQDNINSNANKEDDKNLDSVNNTNSNIIHMGIMNEANLSEEDGISIMNMTHKLLSKIQNSECDLNATKILLNNDYLAEIDETISYDRLSHFVIVLYNHYLLQLI